MTDQIDRSLCTPDIGDVAVCHHDPGCLYGDKEGNLARGGREQLRAFLISEPERADSEGRGCGCRNCTGVERPMSDADADADAVLNHVSPRVATLFCLGKVDFRGCEECEQCGHLSPLFTDSPTSQRGALAQRRCPYHGSPLRSV
ncbi:hypothetical protein [Mycolicibacterium helvum]|uniref:Uncharacterized protein n=1 Tax=Mycolicibacterium helvum TaxID=1534349 RepID=A0A7I7TEW8_9MYCO|nr:hypothetical protein [Mycolicibacterium helvum]BBY67764.1 hypothetical protein MHEL_60070 [Mycolicibacterium helvum]